MPSGLFQRYVSDMRIYHAERMLDGAQIAFFPEMKVSGRRDYMRHWKRLAARAANSVLTFNGVKVTRDQLRSMVRGVRGLDTGVDVE